MWGLEVTVCHRGSQFIVSLICARSPTLLTSQLVCTSSSTNLYSSSFNKLNNQAAKDSEYV